MNISYLVVGGYLIRYDQLDISDMKTFFWEYTNSKKEKYIVWIPKIFLNFFISNFCEIYCWKLMSKYFQYASL